MSDFIFVLSHICTPLWKLSSRNRVTQLAIHDRVLHGITFMALSPILAALLPIPAVLLPIPAAIDSHLCSNWMPMQIIVRLPKHY